MFCSNIYMVLAKALLFILFANHYQLPLHYVPQPSADLEWYATDHFSLPGPKNDASSTLIWIEDQAHLFYNYWSLADGRAYSEIARGRDIATLETQEAVTIGNDAFNTHRWFESILPAEDGTLYGFYHSEEKNPCGFYIKSPEIGMTKSTDQGRTWVNMGIVLKADDNQNDCSAANGFFSNGAGDFAAIYDREKKFVYILFSNYPMQDRIHNQGVAAARIAVPDLDNPVGKVFKWYNGSYSEPGIDGQATPFFRTFKDFTAPDPDSYWGPSVHYNNFLKKYVMVMTRTKGGNSTKALWPTEGIYMSTNEDLSDPNGWSAPTKIVHGGNWYPQFIGFNRNAADSSTEMGEWGRFFMEGRSYYIVRFKK